MQDVLNRRKFCKYSALALTGLALPLPTLAGTSPLVKTRRELSFFNTHTGELLECVTYWSRGVYLSDGLEKIDYLLRDHRANDVTPIDHNLLDTLYLLTRKLDNNEPLHVISGYRSPATNAQLSSQGSGVAKRSLHTQGRAIDIRIPGINLTELRQTALALGRGGVGFYPESQFLHLDTGRARTWQG